MTITSETDICKLSQSKIGNSESVTNIDGTARNKAEVEYSLWYDICRQELLELLKPSFALDRKKVALISSYSNEANHFGYQNIYQKPSQCLAILGIGNASSKENNYALEGNNILTDETTVEGTLPVRFVKDITDVTKFSASFKNILAHNLAIKVCLKLTGDKSLLKELKAELPNEKLNVSAINSQQSRPILKRANTIAEARANGTYLTNQQFRG